MCNSISSVSFEFQIQATVRLASARFSIGLDIGVTALRIRARVGFAYNPGVLHYGFAQFFPYDAIVMQNARSSSSTCLTHATLALLARLWLRLFVDPLEQQ